MKNSILEIKDIVKRTNYNLNYDYLFNFINNSLELINEFYEESVIDIKKIIGKLSVLILVAGIKNNCDFENIINEMYKIKVDEEFEINLITDKIECVDLIFNTLYDIYNSIKLFGSLNDEEVFEAFRKFHLICEFYCISIEECINLSINS